MPNVSSFLEGGCPPLPLAIWAVDAQMKFGVCGTTNHSLGILVLMIPSFSRFNWAKPAAAKSDLGAVSRRLG